jgi:hypothetical protein
LVPVVHGQSGSRAAFELVFYVLDVWTVLFLLASFEILFFLFSHILYLQRVQLFCFTWKCKSRYI